MAEEKDCNCDEFDDILRKLRECEELRSHDRKQREEEVRGALERCEQKQEQLREALEEERDSFREKINEASSSQKSKIEKLQKRITAMTIAGSAGAAVVGKEVVDNVSDNFALISAILSGDIDAVMNLMNNAPATANPGAQSDTADMSENGKASKEEGEEEGKEEEEKEEEKEEEEEEEEEEEKEEEQEKESEEDSKDEESTETASETPMQGLPMSPEVTLEPIIIELADLEKEDVPETPPLLLADLPPFLPPVQDITDVGEYIPDDQQFPFMPEPEPVVEPSMLYAFMVLLMWKSPRKRK